jgi:hypothetical protein
MQVQNYKLSVVGIGGKTHAVYRLSDGACIPFDPANTDYANFKKEILEGTAQLQDADGVEMTAEAAKDFVRGLP